jgi:hypothetical protein
MGGCWDKKCLILVKEKAPDFLLGRSSVGWLQAYSLPHIVLFKHRNSSQYLIDLCACNK